MYLINLRQKISSYILIFVLFFFPLSNLIYYLNPIELYGVNLYSLICFVSLYLVFTINIIFKKKILLNFLIFLSLFFLIIFLNFFFHTSNYKYLHQYEVVISIIIFLILCLQVIDSKNINWLGNIIILSCLTQAIFSIYNEFTVINKITFFNYDDENRQTGFLLNANLFASFISMGFILNLHKKYNFFENYFSLKNSKLEFLINILIATILYSALFYTESRFSIYFSFFYLILFFIYQFYKIFSLKLFLIISISVLSLIAIFLVLLFSSIKIDNRIAMGFNDSIRVLKYFLGIKTILLNPYDLLMGMDREYFTQLRMANTRVSDNSIIYMIMYIGLPFTCILFLFAIHILTISAKINILSIFLLIGLISNLFLTGAIFWHVYLIYFCATYFIIFKNIE